MRSLWTVRGSLVLLTLLVSASARADAFVNFFSRQKVGQEISVTGGFRRFSYKRKFLRRDYKTGEVEHFEYFGMSMVCTRIIGGELVTLPAWCLDYVFVVYCGE